MSKNVTDQSAAASKKIASRRIDILVNALRSNEATGDHTIALARALLRQQATVRVFSPVVGALPPDIQMITHTLDASDYPADADLCIVQYAAWYPLAEVLHRIKMPTIFWYHGITPPELWSAAADQAILRNGRQRTNLVWLATLAVCTSPFTAQELTELTHYPSERTLIVPLGIDTRHFTTPCDPQQLNTLRTRWQLHGKRILLYVGRIAEHKRIDLLIDAMAQLHTDLPNLHALIVGDVAASTATRDLHKILQAQAVAKGIEPAITFTGRVETVTPYYQLAELYVQPSQHEGFGAPLGEAMAAGLPVIASASGAMPWVLDANLVDKEAAGCLFTPGDSVDLAHQIKQLLADPARRTALIARGKARVADFELESFDAHVQAVIAAALTSAQQTPPAPSRPPSPLYAAADVALRDYKVRSSIPGLGRLIEWVRTNSTAHLKEAYLDRIIEQQVNYNRQMAQELARLQAEVEALQREIDALKRRDDRMKG